MSTHLLFRAASVSMISSLLYASQIIATGPSLSGSVAANFHFVSVTFPPGSPSYWAWNNATGNLTLSIPSTIDTTIKASEIGPATLNWSTASNCTQPALDMSGVSIGQSGSGTFTSTINFGSPTLDVFRGFGPVENASTFSQVDITHASGTGEPVHFPDFATIQSNQATSKFNVTIPAGAKVHNDQFAVTVENLTVQSGGTMLDPLFIVRHNLTNHGSGSFGGTVQGNFINDAVAASGNTATVSSTVLQGQLQNTGELYIPGYFDVETATSNAGSIFLNLGQMVVNAPFTNSGSFSTSGNVTINGTSSFTNNGVFQWAGGMIGDGSGFVNNSSAFSISGPASKTLFEPFTNTATITESGGDLGIGHGQTLTNQAGALFDITDDSTISAGFQGGAFANAGTLRKSGGQASSTIGVPVTNTGTIAINAGTLSFTDALTLNPAGKLAFQLFADTPASHPGKLDKSGNLTLAGIVQITLAPGFLPALGNSFDLINWGGTLSGTFSKMQLPLLASGLKWDTSQLYTTGVLAVAAGIPGDFNQNGVVDAADYVAWRDNLGTIYTQADYNTWRTHFGQTVVVGPGLFDNAAVPEPNIFHALSTACILFAFARIRR